MKNWEQAWLVYQPVKDDTEKEIFRTYYIEEKGRYTESIERELAAACQSLFGITPERVSDRKDAGLVLEKIRRSRLEKKDSGSGFQIPGR